MLMNELGEFVDPEPACAYPKLAGLDPKRFAPDDERECAVGFGRYERICTECGTMFRTTSHRRVTCSAACSRKRKLRQCQEKRSGRGSWR